MDHGVYTTVDSETCDGMSCTSTQELSSRERACVDRQRCKTVKKTESKQKNCDDSKQTNMDEFFEKTCINTCYEPFNADDSKLQYTKRYPDKTKVEIAAREYACINESIEYCATTNRDDSVPHSSSLLPDKKDEASRVKIQSNNESRFLNIAPAKLQNISIAASLQTTFENHELSRTESTNIVIRKENRYKKGRCISFIFLMVLSLLFGAGGGYIIGWNVERDNVTCNETLRHIEKNETCSSETGSNSLIDCEALYNYGGVNVSGVYAIHPKNQSPMAVYCDMENGNGSWTVFQRRFDGSVDFFKTWEDYKNGFGDLNGEFWLGNEKLHNLTKQGQSQLRVDLTDWNNEKRYAVYDGFSIGPESDKYTLRIGSYIDGNAGDSMRSYNQNQPFSTKDRDNDTYIVDHAQRAMQVRGGLVTVSVTTLTADM